MKVWNRDRGTVLAEAADVADTSAKRRTGLLKHSKLEPGEGLWIAPCEAVHSFGMKFAIDVVYLDRKKKSAQDPEGDGSAAAVGLSDGAFGAGVAGGRGGRAGPSRAISWSLKSWSNCKSM